MVMSLFEALPWCWAYLHLLYINLTALYLKKGKRESEASVMLCARVARCVCVYIEERCRKLVKHINYTPKSVPSIGPTRGKLQVNIKTTPFVG